MGRLQIIFAVIMSASVLALGTVTMIYKFKAESLQTEVQQLSEKTIVLQQIIDAKTNEIDLLNKTVDLHNDIAIQRQSFQDSIDKISRTTRSTIQKELQKSEDLRNWGSTIVPESITGLLKGYSLGSDPNNSGATSSVNGTNQVSDTTRK